MESLIVYPQHGLANRLRALVSAKILAEYTGRKLFVNWVPSRECNVEWQELFLDRFERCPLPLSRFRVGINLYDDSVIPISLSQYAPRLSIYDQPDQIAVHTCRNFRPENMSNEAYADAKSFFYKKLRPVAVVEKTVEDIEKQCFEACNVIGVHIRRSDHLIFLKRDHRLVCPTSMFIQTMDNILHTKPETRFFLATDDKREETQIRRLFPGAVIVQEKEKISRNTAEGMREALVDWILLSKTSRIIASYASSFSLEAGAVDRIETDIIVREDALSKRHFRPFLAQSIKTHYRVLKEKGVKEYFLCSYNYRKKQLLDRLRDKPSHGDEET